MCKQRVFVALFLAVLAGNIALPFKTTAVTSAAGGLTVTPAQINLEVSKDHPEARTSLTITSTYDVDVSVRAELRSIDENGARLIPGGALAKDTASALVLAESELLVPARGQTTLSLVANDSEALLPGGHYASLVLSQQKQAQVGSSLVSAVAVNVFLIKADGVRRDIRLRQIDAHRTLFRLPGSVTMAFENKGNIHIVPRGSVGFYDDDGLLLSRAVINTRSRMLLPSRSGSFSAPVASLGRVWTPKRVTMQAMYRIDGTDVQLTQQQVFWYVPFIDVLALLLLLVVIWRLRTWIRRKKLRKLGAHVVHMCTRLIANSRAAVRLRSHKQKQR